jgi:RNA polymerase sigma factor (sigma-70 family)
MTAQDEPADALRPLLFSIAYRMLGTVSDAEDIVQETFLRYQRALGEGTHIDSTRAYLSAVTTRLAIDHLRSARVRRESYVGQWLPEPLLTDDTEDPAGHAEQADSLSMAFLLVLERLNPVERAVFLLHDVFGYGYDEVSRIVGKSEANSRQLAARARRHLEESRRRFDASRQEQQELAERFFAAVGDGDVNQLVDMLAADVVVYGDGGRVGRRVGRGGRQGPAVDDADRGRRQGLAPVRQRGPPDARAGHHDAAARDQRAPGCAGARPGRADHQRLRARRGRRGRPDHPLGHQPGQAAPPRARRRRVRTRAPAPGPRCGVTSEDPAPSG